MSSPDPFPCGGKGQRPCPPTPAAVATEPVQYTLADMQLYGEQCYQKGWGDADLARFGPIAVPEIPGTVWDQAKGTTIRPKGDDGPAK